MGEMEGWMDETFIKNVFQTVLGETVQVKVIRDRNSGYVNLSLPYTAIPCFQYTLILVYYGWARFTLSILESSCWPRFTLVKLCTLLKLHSWHS